MCYKLTFTATAGHRGYSCAARVDPNHRATPLRYSPLGHIRIHSPGYRNHRQYPNNYLCYYGIPQCPKGRLARRLIMWDGDDFRLEEPGKLYSLNSVCSDTVHLRGRGLSPRKLRYGGATLLDADAKALCGSQDTFIQSMSGAPVSVRTIAMYTHCKNKTVIISLKLTLDLTSKTNDLCACITVKACCYVHYTA